MTPGLDNLANVEGGYDDKNSVIDYNYYASGSQEVDLGKDTITNTKITM